MSLVSMLLPVDDVKELSYKNLKANHNIMVYFAIISHDVKELSY